MKYNEADSCKRLFEKLGNPQSDLSFVHIESCFGRESVSAYVGTVLKCAGYKVGRYVTTDVFEEREHFQVGGRMISKKGFCELTEKCREICDGIVAEGHPHPAPGDVEAAMAFWYFRQQECDVVLLEDKNEKTDCMIDLPAARKIKYGLEKQKFDYREWKNLEISQVGVSQIQIAIFAIEILQKMGTQGYEISEKALRKGLLATSCSGQFSVISKKPYFVVDCVSHINHAINLVQSMEVYFANKRIIFAIAMTCDAEYEQIIRLTHKYADWIITVAPQAESRALSSYELAAEVTKVHANVTAVDSPEEAVEISRLLAGKEDVVIAFGPHSFIRRLMEIAKNSKL